MPFRPNHRARVVADGDECEPPTVVLEVTGTTTFTLLTELTYEDPGKHTHVARPGDPTDLASIPSFLWGFLAPYGHQLRPALVHDRLCKTAQAHTDRAQRRAARRAADLVFRQALRDERVPLVRRSIFHAGVRLGSWQKNRWYAAVALLLLGVLSAGAGWGIVVSWAGDHDHTLTLVAGWSAALFVAPVLFWKDYRAGFTVAAIAPVVIPLALVDLVGSGVLWLVDAVLFVIRKACGINDAPPLFQPTVAPPLLLNWGGGVEPEPRPVAADRAV